MSDSVAQGMKPVTSWKIVFHSLVPSTTNCACAERADEEKIAFDSFTKNNLAACITGLNVRDAGQTRPPKAHVINRVTGVFSFYLQRKQKNNSM